MMHFEFMGDGINKIFEVFFFKEKGLKKMTKNPFENMSGPR